MWDIWIANTKATSNPESIVVVTADQSFEGIGVNIVRAGVDLGHNHELPQDRVLGGWSAGFLVGAMMAIHADADFIYKEQDCLAFGPWVNRLYEDLGDGDFVTGQFNRGGAAHGLLAQSLVLIRRESIRVFVSRYTAIGTPERHLNTEQKMQIVAQYLRMKQTTMGYDRTRPIDYKSLPFYAQQLTANELSELSSVE